MLCRHSRQINQSGNLTQSVARPAGPVHARSRLHTASPRLSGVSVSLTRDPASPTRRSGRWWLRHRAVATASALALAGGTIALGPTAALATVGPGGGSHPAVSGPAASHP